LLRPVAYTKVEHLKGDLLSLARAYSQTSD
jgi:hypothetical protein